MPFEEEHIWIKTVSMLLEHCHQQPFKEHEVVQTEGDPCTYVSRDDDEIVIIAVYIDDTLIGAKSDKKIAEVKTAIANHFEGRVTLLFRSQSYLRSESRYYLVGTTSLLCKHPSTV